MSNRPPKINIDVQATLTSTGFAVVPSQIALDKQARTQRMATRKASPPKTPVLTDVWSFLEDIADRQQEILDALTP